MIKSYILRYFTHVKYKINVISYCLNYKNRYWSKSDHFNKLITNTPSMSSIFQFPNRVIHRVCGKLPLKSGYDLANLT